MDVLFLARLQFALTTVYHFFFVPVSIGLAVAVAIMEVLYVVKKQDVYKDMARFWGKIFILSFAVGVVTGIIQEFQFGMGWSEYSRFVGDIFGAPLAIEALLAFFMESTFIGLWLFGWDRFSKGVHLACILLVAIGSTFSSFWILAANTFMQYPGGYVLENGRAILTDFTYIFTNKHVWLQFAHVWFAAVMTAACIIAALSALKLLHSKDKAFFQKSFSFSLVLLIFSGIFAIGAGHTHTQFLLKAQPMKFAAMEALYENSGDPGDWALIAGIDSKNQRNNWELKIPYVMSILSFSKMSGSVEGMLTIGERLTQQYGDRDYIPPVKTLFWSFRLMAFGATLLILLGLLGALFNRGGNLEKKTWYLRLMGWTLVLPFLLNSAGWLITELGRYPWTVYGLFTIEQSVSPNISAGALLFSIIAFMAIFTLLAAVLLVLVRREWQKGPYAGNEAHSNQPAVDPFGKEAYSE